MKKLLTAIILAFTFSITNAQATTCPDYMSELEAVHIHGHDPVHPSHHSHSSSIVPVAIFVGLAVVVGIIAYEASSERTWTTDCRGLCGEKSGYGMHSERCLRVFFGPDTGNTATADD